MLLTLTDSIPGPQMLSSDLHTVALACTWLRLHTYKMNIFKMHSIFHFIKFSHFIHFFSFLKKKRGHKGKVKMLKFQILGLSDESPGKGAWYHT